MYISITAVLTENDQLVVELWTIEIKHIVSNQFIIQT